MTLISSDPIDLPPHCSTAAARMLLASLRRAIALDCDIVVDAAAVAFVGQATLQILLAAEADAAARGRTLMVQRPSEAFLAAAAMCGLAAGRPADMPTNGEVACGPAAAKRILIVDDSPSIRALLTLALTDQGHRVDVAEDGEEGLARLHAAGPDMMVTDINMPRLDGFGLIDAARAIDRFGELPIIVLSTEDGTDKRRRAYHAGASGWMTKPYDPRRLGMMIRRVCP